MTLRAGRSALAGAALAVGLGLGGSPHAQVTPEEERCRAIVSMIGGLIIEYRGQISSDLIADLQRKVGEFGACDGPDQYRVWPNTKDRELLGRLRTMIAAWDACRRDAAREGCNEQERR